MSRTCYASEHLIDFVEKFVRDLYDKILHDAEYHKRGPFLHNLPDIDMKCIKDMQMSYELVFWDRKNPDNTSNIEIEDYEMRELLHKCVNQPALNKIALEVNRITNDWRQLADLSSVFIDKRDSMHDIEVNMPYIIECGYVPEGQIRETHTGTKIEGNSHNHVVERVAEYGLIFNRTESVVTGSTYRSEQKEKYKYWQVYKLGS